jgi:uncharacterized protein YxeA
MKKILSFVTVLLTISSAAFTQEKKESKDNIPVPAIVKAALYKKYAEAKNVTWEKEKGNYEANWGGKSGEDNSVQFTPSGNFIEIVKAISVNQLPPNVIAYVKQHYQGAAITEAGKVTDAKENSFFEAEVRGKDIIFDEKGNFVKTEK